LAVRRFAFCLAASPSFARCSAVQPRVQGAVVLDFRPEPGTIVAVSSSALAVVNPVAGRAHGARLRPRVVAELERLFPGIRVIETAYPGHATELLRGADADPAIVVGGDGTVREAAAALAGTNRTLGIVPVGSGNDLLKTLGVPGDPLAACRVCRDGQTRRIDVVRVRAEGSGGLRDMCFVNAAGFGFDAAVVAEARKSTRLRGLPLYLAAVFRAVRSYNCPLARITVAGRVWEQRILMLAAANGRIYGGGMKIAPEALPDDGLVDVCVIDAVSRLTIYRRLPRFVAGTHVSLKEVSMYRAAELELEFLEPVMVQLDGDLVPDPTLRRFRLEVLPSALKVRS